MRLISTVFSLFIVFSQLAYGQTPNATTSTVTVSPATIRTSGTSTITVQLKDANGNNITSGGSTVTFSAPSTGSIGTVTNNGDGTYTATYTASTTTGLVTITPSVNNVSFTNTATIGIGTILMGAKGGHTDASTYSTTGGLTLGLGLRTRYLIVGGGGGGGSTGGGGGGAGGFIEGDTALIPGNYSVTVGTGGAGSTAGNTRGTNGGNSSFIGLIADGGGGGGSFSSASTTPRRGADGGSGGGGSNDGGGGTATTGQGKNGGVLSYGDASGGATVTGGGGGGAGVAGGNGINNNGGDGGAGKSSNITGNSIDYAGGGGGGVGSSVSTRGLGGQGGGGNGGRATDQNANYVAATNGVDGLGGGGGGAGARAGGSGPSGKGGSGIVILQYTDAASATGGSITNFTGNGNNGTNAILYDIHSFTTTGISTFNLTAIDYDQISAVLSTAITGTGALNFNSPGRLILTAANTYSGGTNIRYGTLQIGNGGTTGVLGTGNVLNHSTLAFNRTNALSVSNVISGSGGISQNGTGSTLTLTGTNTYTGNTQVNAGTLLINGNHTAATGNVTVATSAKLGGTGTIGGAITIQNGGELMPGTSPGILTAANALQLSSGSTFTWELTANSDNALSRGTSYDGVNVTGGSLTIETGVTSSLVFSTGVNFTDVFWRADHQWLVFDNLNASTLNSSEIFDQISISTDAGGRTLTSQTGLGGARFFWTIVGNDVYLNYESGFPSSAKSQIFSDRSFIPVNSGVIANLTIQLKDANDNNLTYTGGTLTITASSGTITNITDNNNGTYSAVFNPGSSSPGTVTITPSINGSAFTNTVQVDIVNEISLPSSPDGLETKDSYSTGTNGITFKLGLGAEYLIIGGGGAGGSLGGGGGAGELIEGNQVVFNGIANSIVVGNGGQTSSTNGFDSRFNSIVARGGGGGGNIGNRGKSGGSGGGGSRNTDGGIDGFGHLGGATVKSIGFGNSGGQSRGYAGQDLKGGGGGGSGAAGESAPTGNTIAGNGGVGKQSSISGVATFYAAGGGGGAGSSIGAAGLGGQGGGGNGGRGATSVGADGTNNTGSGGGGGGSTNGSGAAGGKGGSGLVLVRYFGSSDLADGGTESAITVNGNSYRLHTFSNVGSNTLTFNFSNFDFSTYAATLSGNITGAGSLTFNNGGILKLTGTNNYTGSTIISSGSLIVNSSIATSSGVTVSSGATLSGTGTLPATTVSGTHAPGTSPGVQTVSGNLTYNAGSSINWELISNAIGTRGTDYDGIDVTGNLNFAGATTLNLIFNSTGSLVDWANDFWRNAKTGTNGWKLFEVSGSVSGLNNVTVTLSSAATDKDGDLLSAQRSGLTTSFSLVQSGTGIYINYNASANNITWTGTTNTNWSTTTNWNPNGTPTTDNSIVIGTSSNAPLFSGTATYRSLTVNTGATFNITSGTMSIYEDVTNNGTIAGAGTLQLNGTTAQTISGTGTIGNITINNTSGGVSIASGSNKQYITGVFTPTSGVTTTNGNLVFRSTASTEGVVGTVGTCPTEPISGDVTVEKYIPAKRAFRFLTPGVTTTTTIKANWQEGGVVTTPGYPGTYPTDATANPNAGYGTHITGAGGAANGFDETVTNNPSLFTFNPNSNLWVAAANTNSTLSQGEAYRILFRGSRAVNMNDNAAAADATTLRTTGTLKVCNTMSFTTSSTIPLNPSATGYSFIGNPYWSVVDWHTVTKSGVEDNLYYWDPTINGTNGRGAYVTYSAATGVNNISPAGASQVSRYIQPGQAFFVRNTTATPTLTIAPTDIVGSSPSRTLIFSKNSVSAGAELGEEDRLRVRGNTSTSLEKIYVSLLLKNKLASGPADGFVVAYANNFTDEYGREDAAKFGNLDENISAFYKGVRQSILGMQSVSATQLKSDTIPVSMSNLYDGEYVMRISVDKSVDPSREIYLLNRTTNQQTKVDNLNGLDHAFLISAGVKTKDDLALVVNSRRITTAPRSRSKQLVVYPNPLTTGVAEIIVPNTDGKMMLFNSMSRVEVIDNRGQVVLSEGIMLDAMGRGSIDLNGIAFGGYVVRVYVGNQVFTSKLLKQ